jgi:glycosyltransferase 2 family protein
MTCVGYLLRAYRWRVLLAPLGEACLLDLFAATTVGFASVFLLGRAGEIVRPVILPLRDPRIRPAASFVTIMVERLCDLTAVVVLFAMNLLWLKLPAAQSWRVRAAGIGLLFVTAAVLAALTWYRRKSKAILFALRSRLARSQLVPARLGEAILSVLEQLAAAFRVLVEARELAITAGWTALTWIAIATATLLVLRAFALPFGLTEAIFVLGWAMAGSLMPTPGGAAGVFHAATAGSLMLLGVTRDKAAAVSIVMHLIDFGPAVFFGIYYIVRGDVSIAKLRTLTARDDQGADHGLLSGATVPCQVSSAPSGD